MNIQANIASSEYLIKSAQRRVEALEALRESGMAVAAPSGVQHARLYVADASKPDEPSYARWLVLLDDEQWMWYGYHGGGTASTIHGKDRWGDILAVFSEGSLYVSAIVLPTGERTVVL